MKTPQEWAEQIETECAFVNQCGIDDPGEFDSTACAKLVAQAMADAHAAGRIQGMEESIERTYKCKPGMRRLPMRLSFAHSFLFFAMGAGCAFGIHHWLVPVIAGAIAWPFYAWASATDPDMAELERGQDGGKSAARLGRCIRPEGHEGKHCCGVGVEWDEVLPGDFVIRAGKGGEGAKHGSVKLELADGTVMIELCPNGDFLVQGEKVENAKEVYTAFNDWLRKCDILRGAPDGPNGGDVLLEKGK